MFNLNTFYRSKEWVKLREIIIAERSDCICEHCGKPIMFKYDCIAHHKKPLTESNVNDYNISLNADNIALVHHKCHNEIHKRFGSYQRHIYIVYGPPSSGKSTYVDSVALKDDLIIDLNRLFGAINNDRSNRLYENVMALYRQLIDMVKTRNGRWVNAWVVRGFPVASERERLAKELDAELIFIDTDKKTCLERCKNIEWVEDWWNKYTE